MFKFNAHEAKRYRALAAKQLRPAAWRSVWNSFVRFWIKRLGGLKLATIENVAAYEQVSARFWTFTKASSLLR